MLVDKYKTRNGKLNRGVSDKHKVHFVRYADDFIVTANTEEIAKEVKELIKDFLKERGLELSEEKTLITNIDSGFDFLGWNFRKYKGKLLVKPSKKSIDKVTENISDIIKRGKAWKQEDLIKTLNPKIIGWSNYHRSVVSSEIFRNLDSRIWGMLWHWAKRRHPNKSKQWIADKYWHSDGNRKWVFSDGTNQLNLLSDTKIVRHIILKLDMNPHLDKEYFESRKSKLQAKKTTSITGGKKKVISLAAKVTDVAKKTLDKVKNIRKPKTVTITNNCCPNKGL
jgi:RNA-directed DNA polymerase